jgi:hypothetical protein
MASARVPQRNWPGLATSRAPAPILALGCMSVALRRLLQPQHSTHHREHLMSQTSLRNRVSPPWSVPGPPPLRVLGPERFGVAQYLCNRDFHSPDCAPPSLPHTFCLKARLCQSFLSSFLFILLLQLPLRRMMRFVLPCRVPLSVVQESCTGGQGCI